MSIVTNNLNLLHCVCCQAAKFWMPLVAFVLIQVYVADLVLGREAVSSWVLLDSIQNYVALGFN